MSIFLKTNCDEAFLIGGGYFSIFRHHSNLKATSETCCSVAGVGIRGEMHVSLMSCMYGDCLVLMTPNSNQEKYNFHRASILSILALFKKGVKCALCEIWKLNLVHYFVSAG